MARSEGKKLKGTYSLEGNIEYAYCFLEPEQKLRISIDCWGKLDQLVFTPYGVKYKGYREKATEVSKYPMVFADFYRITKKEWDFFRFKEVCVDTGKYGRGRTHFVGANGYGMNEKEWLNKYGDLLMQFRNQYYSELVSIFGVDPLIDDPFWEW